jgi:hypothetical protein
MMAALDEDFDSFIVNKSNKKKKKHHNKHHKKDDKSLKISDNNTMSFP